MDKKQALIRHEILNLITIVNFAVSSSELQDKNKKEILERLTLITLLVKYRDVFLGKEKEIFKRPVDLNEILEAIAMIYEKQFKRNKVKLDIPRNETMIKMDRKLVQEALGQILVELMGHAKKIAITYKNGTLSIKYDSPQKLTDKKINLMKCLTDKEKYPNFAYQLALHLLSLTGAKVKSGKGEMKISFK